MASRGLLHRFVCWFHGPYAGYRMGFVALLITVFFVVLSFIVDP